MTNIRVVRTKDAPAIAAIYRPYVEETVISFEVESPSIKYFEKAIAERLPMYPWLVAEVEGEVVGYAYATAFHPRKAYQWSVESSVYIAQGYHRQGIGRALYDTLLSALRQQGFRMVFAGVTVPNAGSIGLHEKLGFEQVALFPMAGHKLGAWRDVGWWSLDLAPDQNGDDPRQEPIPFSKLPGQSCTD